MPAGRTIWSLWPPSAWVIMDKSVVNVDGPESENLIFLSVVVVSLTPLSLISRSRVIFPGEGVGVGEGVTSGVGVGLGEGVGDCRGGIVGVAPVALGCRFWGVWGALMVSRRMAMSIARRADSSLV